LVADVPPDDTPPDDRLVRDWLATDWPEDERLADDWPAEAAGTAAGVFVALVVVIARVTDVMSAVWLRASACWSRWICCWVGAVFSAATHALMAASDGVAGVVAVGAGAPVVVAPVVVGAEVTGELGEAGGGVEEVPPDGDDAEGRNGAH
jgi:hypothetical protein